MKSVWFVRPTANIPSSATASEAPALVVLSTAVA
jgi:hypothetical protein